MKKKWILPGAILCMILFGMSAIAEADSITWNFTGSGSEGTVGNQRTFTVGGITATATAWGYNTSFQAARLGQWSTGLGVCNTSEFCGSPYHQVDNGGITDDYVLFLFSAPVDPVTVRIDPYGTYDRDVSYWAGNVVLPPDRLAGESYASLAALGFGSRIDDNGTTSSYARNVLINNSPSSVNALLFGGKYNGGGDDYFKITSMSVSAPDHRGVSEPASLFPLGLGILGMVGLVWLRTKRQASA